MYLIKTRFVIRLSSSAFSCSLSSFGSCLVRAGLIRYLFTAAICFDTRPRTQQIQYLYISLCITFVCDVPCNVPTLFFCISVGFVFFQHTHRYTQGYVLVQLSRGGIGGVSPPSSNKPTSVNCRNKTQMRIATHYLLVLPASSLSTADTQPHPCCTK